MQVWHCRPVQQTARQGVPPKRCQQAVHPPTCVCIGLKWLNLYSDSYRGLPSALSGSGSKSSSSAKEG